MCVLEDLLNSTHGSADTMTQTLKDYGESSMGNGIRKATRMSYDQGYNDCLETEVPKAFEDGRLTGYNECRETEVPKAHDEGVLEGVIIGGIATVCVAATIYAGKKLVGYVKGKIKVYKAKKNTQKERQASDNDE